MSAIKLSNEDKAALVQAAQVYARDELDIELGRFDAEFFVEHLAGLMAPIVYNQALRDAQAIVQQRVVDLVDAIDALEK